ncbi:tetra-peptide repeat homeobox protein 1-like, partial [Corapipo altera]|uniref:tetra-peptide repeat homeobox protein 1-like n=1 Tax=Corapipo altera TaxID=415028 RepID=UPI000FD6890E
MRQVPSGSRRPRAAGSSPGPGPGPLPGSVPARGSRSGPLPGPGPLLGLLPSPPRAARPLLPLLLVSFLAAASFLFIAWPAQKPVPHQGAPPGPPSEQELRTLLARLDPPRLWGTFLRPLLRERVPGGPGSRAARQ